MTMVLANEGYKRVRPIVVMPELSDRTVIAQGLLTSTIGFDRKRESNNSFAYVDHVARTLVIKGSKVRTPLFK